MNDSLNPLCISYRDLRTIEDYGYYEVNIIDPNGNYYSQGISGNSKYSPNKRYNIYDN